MILNLKCDPELFRTKNTDNVDDNEKWRFYNLKDEHGENALEDDDNDDDQDDDEEAGLWRRY